MGLKENDDIKAGTRNLAQTLRYRDDPEEKRRMDDRKVQDGIMKEKMARYRDLEKGRCKY